MFSIDFIYSDIENSLWKRLLRKLLAFNDYLFLFLFSVFFCFVLSTHTYLIENDFEMCAKILNYPKINCQQTLPMYPNRMNLCEITYIKTF